MVGPFRLALSDRRLREAKLARGASHVKRAFAEWLKDFVGNHRFYSNEGTLHRAIGLKYFARGKCSSEIWISWGSRVSFWRCANSIIAQSQYLRARRQKLSHNSQSKMEFTGIREGPK
jgi:hypothetical protein